MKVCYTQQTDSWVLGGHSRSELLIVLGLIAAAVCPYSSNTVDSQCLCFNIYGAVGVPGNS